MGKTHLATALGHAACLQGHPVLFTTAIEVINTLSAAQAKCGQNPSSNVTRTRYWSWMKWPIFPSTSAAPICSSRSSANATTRLDRYYDQQRLQKLGANL